MKPPYALTLLTIAALGMVAAAGCAPRKAADGRGPPRSESSADRKPTSATHNWRTRAGDAYVYQGEAPPGQGKPGPPVLQEQRYTYLGERDGVYTLAFNGETASCTNPCDVVTIHAGVFHDERVAFDPDSVIGAAFQDAFDGWLQVPGQAGAARPNGH